MSEEMVLKIQERSDFGTRSSKRMRKAGQVPAVLSHKSDNPIHISISDHDFQMILNKGGRIINLEGAGNAFIKDVQWDHLGDKILHVDFTKVPLSPSSTLARAGGQRIRIDRRLQPGVPSIVFPLVQRPRCRIAGTGWRRTLAGQFGSPSRAHAERS